MFYTIGNVFATINSKLVNRFDKYNPLCLPPNTVRVRTNDGNAPIIGIYASYETATLVPGTSNIYDVYKSGTSFESLLRSSNNVVEVLGANTTGIRNMCGMFSECFSIESVPLFDTSSVTDMSSMFIDCISLTSVPLFATSNVSTMRSVFSGCTSLTSVPLFDTSSVTDMSYMFNECYKLKTVQLFDTSSVTNMNNMFYLCHDVQTGALALYQQASLQTTPPTYHKSTFYQCGINTQTGYEELAQIPDDWK